MGTWHEHLDRRSKAGLAYHEAGMHAYAEQQRMSEQRRKRALSEGVNEMKCAICEGTGQVTLMDNDYTPYLSKCVTCKGTGVLEPGMPGSLYVPGVGPSSEGSMSEWLATHHLKY